LLECSALARICKWGWWWW